MDMVAEQIRGQSSSSKDIVTQRLSDVTKEIAATEEKHANIIRAFTSGFITDSNAGTLNSELDALQQHLGTLNKEATTLKDSIRVQRRREYNAKRVAQVFNTMACNLENCEDRDAQRRFLRSSIEAIRPTADTIHIQYRLGSNSEQHWHPLVVSVELVA